MGGQRVRRRRILAASSGFLAGAVAGCLDPPAGEDDPELGDPEPYVEVELSGIPGDPHLDPPVVHLVDGGILEWVVESGSHDVTAYHPATYRNQQRIPEDADPWTSAELIGEEASFDHQFDGEGVYDYACTTHEDEGAVGSIVVGWPDPDDQPGLSPPSGEYPDAAIEELERYNERVRKFLEEAHR
ncbi:cupredoxin domain-containing protein [Natronobacterium texcoconense]|uniref:Plastocyanin n=1 Tax=Natronobacterium texcoconense TaxID=1095778 RepID=A0A1H0ZED9_NATTX|nr:halocyanin [Natronobacterium texcoconense]SDQ25875.1 Plastocyanin [Natronobacterium texcoconense]